MTNKRIIPLTKDVKTKDILEAISEFAKVNNITTGVMVDFNGDNTITLREPAENTKQPEDKRPQDSPNLPLLGIDKPKP